MLMRAPFTTTHVAPVERRPLRKVHDAIICAVRDREYDRAERLFAKASRVYQAVTHLLVFHHKLAKTVN